MKRMAICIAVMCLLSACVYHHARTDRQYFLHTDYQMYGVDMEHPEKSPDDYIGFCVLPLKKPNDPRGQTAVKLVAYYLKEHGYVPVTQEELIANQDLLDRTFMLGVGYHESFAYETLQLQISLYTLDRETRKNEKFWSWKAKFDGYPLDRRRIEPALQDLFVELPMWEEEKGPLFPKMALSTNAVERFMIDVAAARMAVENERVLRGGD